jgi:hypothetical protein
MYYATSCDISRTILVTLTLAIEMSDIFISYSRKDSKQALELAGRLRAAGINAWIDQGGIEAATSWSKEIVHAIKANSFPKLCFLTPKYFYVSKRQWWIIGAQNNITKSGLLKEKLKE